MTLILYDKSKCLPATPRKQASPKKNHPLEDSFIRFPSVKMIFSWWKREREITGLGFSANAKTKTGWLIGATLAHQM